MAGRLWGAASADETEDALLRLCTLNGFSCALGG